MTQDQNSKNFIDLEKEIAEYKKFAFSKNLLDVAIALILATTFQKTVSSISDNLIMPVVNYLVSGAGENWRTLIVSPLDGMNLELGKFLGVFLEFLITSLVLYLIYFKIVKWLWPPENEVKQ